MRYEEMHEHARDKAIELAREHYPHGLDRMIEFWHDQPIDYTEQVEWILKGLRSRFASQLLSLDDYEVRETIVQAAILHDREKRPACPHSACSQAFIETGENVCIETD